MEICAIRYEMEISQRVNLKKENRFAFFSINFNSIIDDFTYIYIYLQKSHISTLTGG